jgi:L-xylulokinase
MHGRRPYLLGVDSGLTVVKATVFDPSGAVVGAGSALAQYRSPRPRWVERDPEQQWRDCVTAIWAACEAAAANGVAAEQIGAVGLTGHGDGLLLLDGDGEAITPSFPSLDTRAHAVVEEWRRNGVAETVLKLSGEAPFPQHAPAMLTWLRRQQPAVARRARRLLFPKDWVKLRLTGVLCTDPTEASAGFTGVHTRRYSPEVLAAYGLADCFELLPPVRPSTEVVGEVTRSAAAVTGLAPGTPVVSGIHDVDASALGAGGIRPGQLVLVAGTYSVNELLATEPHVDPRWLCRDWAEPGLWMHMSTSAASATNLEWFARQLCPEESAVADRRGISPYEALAREAASAADAPGEVLYLPFLFGSPHGELASAAFLGVRGWHTRAHLLRALIEGVVFNHRTHVDPLRAAMPVSEVRLTGGATRSDWWSQTFADVLELPVRVPAAEETGTLGAALCAGVGAGLYRSLAEATEAAVTVTRVHEPTGGDRQRWLGELYASYTQAVAALGPVWERLDAASPT